MFDRTDPRWVLVQWSKSYWTSPPQRPTPEAELSLDEQWCDHYDRNRSVATWYLDPSRIAAPVESTAKVERTKTSQSAVVDE